MATSYRIATFLIVMPGLDPGIHGTTRFRIGCGVPCAGTVDRPPRPVAADRDASRPAMTKEEWFATRPKAAFPAESLKNPHFS